MRPCGLFKIRAILDTAGRRQVVFLLDARNGSANRGLQGNDNMAEGEKIIPISIEDEMKSAYIDYSMSVIVSRALPTCVMD